MWPLALTLVAFALSQTSAIPVLPLSQAGFERLEELRNNVPKTFIVQVEEPKATQQQIPAQQQPQTREFPWPYPPVFESFLPLEAKQRLVQLYVDSTLSAQERANQINGVFDELPQQVIEKLPLPAEYLKLPAYIYQRIFYIHVAPGFKWAERQQLIRDIVESLPEEQKRMMAEPLIDAPVLPKGCQGQGCGQTRSGPPPGFEVVLAPSVYKQLLAVHQNPSLSKEQKAEVITQIMRQVPQDQIQRLPLPNGFDRLPAEFQQRARSLVYDYSVAQPLRAQHVREFIQSLPEEMRPLLK